MLKELSFSPQFKIFIKNKLILISLILALIIDLFIAVFLYIKIGKPTEPVALKYSIYFEIVKIGEWYKIFIAPLVGFIIVIFNWIISYILYKKNHDNLIFAYFLSGISLFVQIILLISAINLIIINS